MNCQHVNERLDAWADGVLPEDQKKAVEQHLAECTACAGQAASLRILVDSLAAMPAVQAPRQLAVKTMKAFRSNFRPPGMLEWWLSLGPAMRSASCSVAVAGLLLGIGLGSSLFGLLVSGSGGGIPDAISYAGGFLP